MSEREELERRLVAAFRRIRRPRQREAVKEMEAEAAREDKFAADMMELYELHRSLETGDDEES